MMNTPVLALSRTHLPGSAASDAASALAHSLHDPRLHQQAAITAALVPTSITGKDKQGTRTSHRRSLLLTTHQLFAKPSADSGSSSDEAEGRTPTDLLSLVHAHASQGNIIFRVQQSAMDHGHRVSHSSQHHWEHLQQPAVEWGTIGEPGPNAQHQPCITSDLLGWDTDVQRTSAPQPSPATPHQQVSQHRASGTIGASWDAATANQRRPSRTGGTGPAPSPLELAHRRVLNRIGAMGMSHSAYSSIADNLQQSEGRHIQHKPAVIPTSVGQQEPVSTTEAAQRPSRRWSSLTAAPSTSHNMTSGQQHDESCSPGSNHGPRPDASVHPVSRSSVRLLRAAAMVPTTPNSGLTLQSSPSVSDLRTSRCSISNPHITHQPTAANTASSALGARISDETPAAPSSPTALLNSVGETKDVPTRKAVSYGRRSVNGQAQTTAHANTKAGSKWDTSKWNL